MTMTTVERPRAARPTPELLALGARIRMAREARELTATSLARRIGTGAHDLLRTERGFHNVSTLKLYRLACALEVSPAWLLSDDPEVPPLCR